MDKKLIILMILLAYGEGKPIKRKVDDLESKKLVRFLKSLNISIQFDIRTQSKHLNNSRTNLSPINQRVKRSTCNCNENRKVEFLGGHRIFKYWCKNEGASCDSFPQCKCKTFTNKFRIDNKDRDIPVSCECT